MISNVTLTFHETVDLLDGLFPWLHWQSCFEDIIKGEMKGLPKIRFTVTPDGPVFLLANVASFALKFTRLESWSTTDLVEYMLESVVHDKRIEKAHEFDDDLDNDLDNLLGKLTRKGVA